MEFSINEKSELYELCSYAREELYIEYMVDEDGEPIDIHPAVQERYDLLTALMGKFIK